MWILHICSVPFWFYTPPFPPSTFTAYTIGTICMYSLYICIAPLTLRTPPPPRGAVPSHLPFLDSLSVSLQFGVTVAYFLVAYCYFGVAYTGYYAFGNSVGDQILYTLGHPVWVVCVASVMVIVHVCGSFQVCICCSCTCTLFVSEPLQCLLVCSGRNKLLASV